MQEVGGASVPVKGGGAKKTPKWSHNVGSNSQFQSPSAGFLMNWITRSGFVPQMGGGRGSHRLLPWLLMRIGN
jgi:hypothetical protein